MAPLVSLLVDQKVVEPRAYHQTDIFEAATLFARTEGIVPAPETAHAIKATIDEALKCKVEGSEKCIVMMFSGHGHFDLSAYNAYYSGELKDYDLPQELIDAAQKDIPVIE
jgi:tryptophan synthase beta chain